MPLTDALSLGSESGVSLLASALVSSLSVRAVGVDIAVVEFRVGALVDVCKYQASNHEEPGLNAWYSLEHQVPLPE